MAQISDQNFASFVSTMASVLEDIERRKAGNRPGTRPTDATQLELPLGTPTAKPSVLTLDAHKRHAA